ncbi:hypothetical protein O6H91_02G086600 [Diphasiastrum complanatum]|uniref:Uncharacterized protein n=1 Tax=Diphasiastrum complanatum TaxID=34168 RepID=A0ACC2EI38_DIPCM|nr:hypothetical protein O6H91_02G086600 [Diphasiastrum complanatum]
MAPSAAATLPEGLAHGTSDEVSRPFPPLDVKLSDEELRHTAYEIFVAATRVCSDGRPLSTGWRSRSINGQEHSPDSPLPSGSGLVKRTFGGMMFSRQTEKDHSNGTKMKGPSIGADIVRMHLGITEKYDASLRRVLSKTNAQQVGKGIENLLVPLNLLQNMQLSDFSSSQEHGRWRRRQLSVLEAGLLSHPKVALSGADIDWQRLKQLFKEFNEKSVERSKGDKSMQTLRNGIVELACRAGENETDEGVCHWADGFPLNVHLYQMLVASCFDSLNESAVIDEIEEVMELIKKTWGTLGITQRLHNICFAWALFHQFLITGQKEIELLAATKTELKEVEKDVKNERDPVVVKVLVSTLGSMQAWTEKRLLAYHDAFPHGGKGLMQYMLPVAILAAQILHKNTSFDFRLRQKEQSDVASTKINLYIRSSLRTAFAQIMEEADARRRPSKGSDARSPALVVLARRTADLAKSEREKFSPILSLWHAYPAGVAAATLHSCYRRELHQFITRLKILTPEAVQVAESAEQLEQDLVQIAVEDTVDCEDGGKKIVREMSPFDAHTVIAELSQKWLEASLAKLFEWVDRNVKNEDWSPHSLREHYAPSAVEVLRMVEETLDAFFALPISEHPNILQELIDGVDRGLQLYVSQTVGAFGSGKEFIPPLPPLTRWNKELLKTHGKGGSHWWKKDTNKHFYKKKGQPRSSEELHSEISDLERFCVRINTLHYLQSELEGFEKKIRYGWQKSLSKGSETGKKPALPIDQSKTPKFELLREGCKGGIQSLIQVAVHKAIFQNMRSIFWEGLYTGGVANFRVDQLEAHLVLLRLLMRTFLKRTLSC